jgi:uncharacterized BrkB/YihY/UPF0761 family membrane protein
VRQHPVAMIDEPTEPSPPDPDAMPSGRIRRARVRAGVLRAQVNERARRLEREVPAAEAAHKAYNHDREVGGEIMAGAIAFRAFLYLLPLVVVYVIVLGFIADVSSTEQVTKVLGVGGIAADSVTASVRVSSGSRFIALGIALFALYFTAIALARALRIAHALAWEDTVAPMKRTWRAALIVVGASIGLSTALEVVSLLHDRSIVAAVAGWCLVLVVYVTMWLGLSLLLPHRDAPWTSLVPGALFVGIGLQALHVITVVYLSRKLSSASKLYGPMGSAVAILLWAYLLGRLTVASAVLNATLRRRHS